MNAELVELVNKAMKDGYNQYTHMCGIAGVAGTPLPEKIGSLYTTSGQWKPRSPSRPAELMRSTPLTTVLQPGDEVIVFEPAYDSYIPNIEINGAFRYYWFPGIPDQIARIDRCTGAEKNITEDKTDHA